MLIGEVRGLEVCRVVDDESSGEARLEVGVGQHDREAFQMMHGDIPTAQALGKVVAAVAPHRQVGAPPHPLNRIGRERALRAMFIDDPALIGASSVEAVPSPLARSNIKDPHPAVARAMIDGRPTTIVVSVGVDLDLVPFADRCAAGDRRPDSNRRAVTRRSAGAKSRSPLCSTNRYRSFLSVEAVTCSVGVRTTRVPGR